MTMMITTALLLLFVAVSCAFVTGHGPQMTGHGAHGPIERCDDGQTGVKKDFLMVPKRRWKCRSHPWPNLRNIYEPAGETRCYKTDDPYHTCVGESMEFSTDPPSSGGHRPAYPVYGEYGYIPATRWVHSLEHGAVAFLYHPCAASEEVDLLRQVAKSCLRRHIITPYLNLTREKPFALVAWGCILRMKWVDIPLAKAFVRKHALSKEVEYTMWQDGVYSYALRRRAEIVSDRDESNLCPEATPLPDQFIWTSMAKRSTSKGLTATQRMRSLAKSTSLSISTASSRSHETSGLLSGESNTSQQHQVASTSQQNQVVLSGHTSQKMPSTNAGHVSTKYLTTVITEPLTTNPVVGLWQLSEENSTVATQTQACNSSANPGCAVHQLARTHLVWSVLAVVFLGGMVTLGLLCMRSNSLSPCCSDEVVHFDQRLHKATHVPMRQQLVRFAENLPMSGKSRVTNASDYKRLMQHDVDEDDV